MIVVLVGPIVIGAMVWACAGAARMVRVAGTDRGPDSATKRTPRRDVPAAILAWSARRLRGERNEWADALVAELDSLTGAQARWSLALGSVRIVFARPHRELRSAPVQQSMIVVAALAVVAVATYSHIRTGADALTGGHGVLSTAVTASVVILLLAAEAGLASRRTRSAEPGAAVARRWGIPGGVAMGVALIISETPPLARSGPLWAVGALLVGLGTPLVIAVLASRAAHDGGAGRNAAAWTGALGGFVFLIGLMAITFTATAWFAHDPGTVRSYHDSLSPAHFASYGSHYNSITGFVISENMDTALFGGLLWLPLVALVAGGLGARFSHGRAALQSTEVPNRGR